MKYILLLLCLLTFQQEKPEKWVWDKDKSNWSPLMMAVYYDDIEEVKKMIEDGADLNYIPPNHNLINVLMVAIYKNDLEMVEFLYEAGDFKDLQFYFILASRGENPMLIDYFISKGAQVNEVSENGHSVLMSAARYGSPSVTKRLIECGANVNQQRKVDDATPLMFAVYGARIDNIEILLKNGANKNLKRSDNETALDLVETISYRLQVSEEKKEEIRDLIKNY